MNIDVQRETSREDKPLTRADVERLLREAGSPDKLNLSGRNLSMINLTHFGLSGANLSGANLSQARLDNADLSGANLSEANLDQALMGGTNLSGANLSRVKINTISTMAGANLSGANLSEADLSWVERHDFREVGDYRPNL